MKVNSYLPSTLKGHCISIHLTNEDGCSSVLTTQASTKGIIPMDRKSKFLESEYEMVIDVYICSQLMYLFQQSQNLHTYDVNLTLKCTNIHDVPIKNMLTPKQENMF
ncbi:unnamed protein product [Lactuca virosa]|uniref:Uncharacterized protein n=1 Tax=Lactuca virosa TaxID=75947 RepID=A0AAU9MHT7_9ASTR|nr:unnamed protein product [Lactuca virosa]